MDYRFGEFEIDLGQHELRRSGQAVRIEPQVFDLLLYLVRHRDRIVSKDELIEAIWQGRVISEAALSTCISAARRAVGDSGESQSLIRTVPKRGFRFVGGIDHEPSPQLMPANDGNAADVGLAAKPVELLLDAADAPPLALPDKPSIAILPFQNLSGDPDQEYFADGLTEDIITGLSRQRWFFVIARNSTFAFKGGGVDVRKVAGELGVRYVLEGSVRRSADRVRVTGQLIDAVHGVHLWADRYDRELANVFELQDDITNKVIGSVGPQILVAEAARVRRKPPQSMDAWDLVLQALPHMWRASADEQRRAQELLQQAIAIDPDYAHAHALLGWTHVSLFNLVVGQPISEFTDKALEFGAKAVALDSEEPWAHLVLGMGHSRRRRPEPAVAHLSKSVELNPSFALGHAGPRLRAGVRRRTGARPASAGAGGAAEPARSIPGVLCADRAVHGAVCARTLRGGDRGLPRDCRLASQSRGRMAPDDGIAGAARPHRRGQTGARAYTASCSPIFPPITSRRIRCSPIRPTGRAFCWGFGRPDWTAERRSQLGGGAFSPVDAGPCAVASC